ncbi:hypothetical protein ACLOJK_029624, partial [Asimina triloba]
WQSSSFVLGRYFGFFRSSDRSERYSERGVTVLCNDFSLQQSEMDNCCREGIISSSFDVMNDI